MLKTLSPALISLNHKENSPEEISMVPVSFISEMHIFLYLKESRVHLFHFLLSSYQEIYLFIYLLH